MAGPDLDRWLAHPMIRTRHRRVARADADSLWRAAESLRLRDTRTLGRVVRWRIPGLTPDQSFDEIFRAYPFTVLDRGERCLVSGLVGRIWTLERDYPRLDGPEAFEAWDDGGTVRVVLGHWVEDDAAGSALVSEARISPGGRRAAIRLRALWTVVGGFERLIGGEALRAAVRRAERS